MRVIPAALLFCLLSGTTACDRLKQSTVQKPVATADLDETAASTVTVFDLSPTEKAALSERALRGDPEASFRLARYYGLAGGDGDPNINDEHDRQQERRWLELASEQGHHAAQLGLAINLAGEDCPRARSMLIKIRDRSDDPDQRESAAGWLDEPRFACR